MGKITLTFDSNEEAEEARTALDASKWKIVAWDLDQYLRGKIKYCPDNEDPAAYETVKFVFNNSIPCFDQCERSGNLLTKSVLL